MTLVYRHQKLRMRRCADINAIYKLTTKIGTAETPQNTHINEVLHVPLPEVLDEGLLTVHIFQQDGVRDAYPVPLFQYGFHDGSGGRTECRLITEQFISYTWLHEHKEMARRGKIMHAKSCWAKYLLEKPCTLFKDFVDK